VRELGRVALDEDQQHLEQRGALVALFRCPRAKLSHDRVNQRAEVVAHAHARTERRPTRKGVRQRNVEPRVALALVLVAVL